MNKILLCSDLDRTLLPNGPQPESPQARPLLREFAARPEVTLVYVSGRHKQLLLDAIREYDIPTPDYAIGDVGTTIYEISGNHWHPWEKWDREIATDWRGLRHQDLAALLSDIPDLQLQEPEKQNTFKLSYYVSSDVMPRKLLTEINQRLAGKAVHANLIWSIDEIKDTGLLDILPRRANKLHAIEFLMEQKGFARGKTVFAGDSGNDIDVFDSGLQSVLVRNASDEVRREAISRVKASGHGESLYLAQGDFHGMNGNYTAGVLEGLAHFIPEARQFINQAAED